MINIQIVPLEFLHNAWKQCEKFILKAVKYSNGDTNIEQMKVFLAQDIYKLMVFLEDDKVVAAVVFYYINLPSHRIFFIQALGGKTTKEHFDMMYKYAKATGASRVRYACRDSVARLSAIKHGFTKIYNTVERIL